MNNLAYARRPEAATLARQQAELVTSRPVFFWKEGSAPAGQMKPVVILFFLGIIFQTHAQHNFIETTNIKNAKEIILDEIQPHPRLTHIKMHIKKWYQYDKIGRLKKYIGRDVTDRKSFQKVIIKYRYKNKNTTIERVKSTIPFGRGRGKVKRITLIQNDTSMFGLTNNNIRHYIPKVTGIPTSDTSQLVSFDTALWNINTFLNIRQGFDQILKTVILPDSTAKAQFVYYWKPAFNKYVLYRIYVYTSNTQVDGTCKMDFYKTVYGLTNKFYHDSTSLITLKGKEIIKEIKKDSESNYETILIYEYTDFDKMGSWGKRLMKQESPTNEVLNTITRTIIYW